MRDKFLFFDFKRSKFLNLLIIMQVCLWLFYIASLISLFRFDSSYHSRFERSIDTSNSAMMVFYKMIPKATTEEIKTDYIDKIQKTLTLLHNNGYEHGTVKRDPYTEIPLDVLKSTNKDVKNNFSLGQSSDNMVIKFNPSAISHYNNNIIGEISTKDWITKNDYIPTVLGFNYSKKFNIGESFSYDNKTYLIKGFFKKDSLTFDYSDAVNSSFLLNSSIVIPGEDKDFFENFSYEPIVIYPSANNTLNLKDIEKISSSISSDIVVKDLNEDLNIFLTEIKSRKLFETIRILIITLIATASIVATISYKITSDKDRIGLLFCLGIKKIEIFTIFSTEFMINVLIGILLGSMFYIKNCKKVYSFFINENLLSNLYMSIGILLIIVLAIIILQFSEVNKLSPKEMVGGFVE
ncbi:MULTISPECIES: FtsX-like permease family protein [Clostridium]|uniref:FtsX-like permease family protein n=2 Tax=Clostridium cadaveris TaxID=1529 RepID=A0A1I2MXL8_9CLOT|nr:FtsX-like permease family protein [Clostridium cadaveris]MDU4951090.1 FtsX-like permease family protein [Clostridium sp.]MDY4948338.1 FtsX-like permease family protein [Clostridium cadaveris]NME65017.1 FtsX-like permease family protein [Clostridium cadaveris]NWK10435.1 FtsX-like permease family protein [Clostridium cadaveris]PWL52944.1 MAG: hypothetical protein DBY38_08695 [Clostridium cadaveris]